MDSLLLYAASSMHACKLSYIAGTSDCERTSDQSERRASPSQETKPSRDSWLTEKAGRNILTGQLNDPSVAENKAHEVHKPSKVYCQSAQQATAQCVYVLRLHK